MFHLLIGDILFVQEETFIAQAWDLYYTVFKRINTVLPQLLLLDLTQISPQLVTAQHLELAVPGTYNVRGHAVKIRSFYPMVSVIRSKQRPRKIRILGLDGLDYMFLLKVSLFLLCDMVLFFYV